jgi:hydrogenase-1 operon protein HyaE
MTIPMPVAAGADPRTYPLIDALFTRHGYTDLRPENLEAFTQRPGHLLLLFLEDPVRYKETLDLAVIVPEIAGACAGALDVGVLLPEAARVVHPRYGFRRWPAFVILKDGEYVGAVDGLRNWDEYCSEVARLLTAAPSRPPSIGVAVRAAGDAAAGG